MLIICSDTSSLNMTDHLYSFFASRNTVRFRGGPAAVIGDGILCEG